MADNPVKQHPCWKEIGIFGDGSCPRLADQIHCRNCVVFAEGGRRLLDRDLPPGYSAEWTHVLAQTKETVPARTLPVIVFRVGTEWLALKTSLLLKVSGPRPAHQLPHRTNRVLRGLVNIDGELILLASLSGLLGIEEPAGAGNTDQDCQRMIVVAREGERWVFPAAAVEDVIRLDQDRLETAPVTVTKAAHACSAGLFSLGERSVALLDEVRLFDQLRGSLGR